MAGAIKTLWEMKKSHPGLMKKPSGAICDPAGSPKDYYHRGSTCAHVLQLPKKYNDNQAN